MGLDEMASTLFIRGPASLKIVLISFFGAIVLMSLPVRAPWVYLRPDGFLLLILYWGLRAPPLMRQPWPFILGLVADVSDYTTMGVHAMVYSVIYAISVHYRSRLQTMPPLNRGIYVALMMALTQVLIMVLVWYVEQSLPLMVWWGQYPANLLLWWVLPRLLEPRRRTPRSGVV